MAPRAGKKSAPSANPPTPTPPGHNAEGPLTQDDMDDLFIVHLAQARKDDDLVEKAMEAVRAAKKARTRNRTLCRTDGFPLKELDNILADELLSRSDVEEREAKRLRMRGVAGQPGGSLSQGDLFDDSFADAERDEAYWRGHGLTIGMRGLACDPEANGVPAERWQTWQQEWGAGQARLGRAMATKARIEGKDPEWEGAAPKPVEPEPVADDPNKPKGDTDGAEFDAETVEHEPA